MKQGASIDKRVRLNQEINAKEVRLIDADGKQAGVVSVEEARRQAQDAGLDLVEIAPQATPPVAKIIDWGKYRYEKTKLAQKAKKKQKSVGIKQVRFGLKIGTHDLNVKTRKIRGFIENGNKVKVSVFFRGREMAHPDLGRELLLNTVAGMSDVVVVEQEPELTGKYLSLVLRRK